MEGRGGNAGRAHVAAFLVALVVAGSLYGAVASWAIERHDSEDPEAVAARRVYEFLHATRGAAGSPRVIVIGASDAREAIDGHLVDAHLAERGLPHETFNLAVGGDTPLRRLPELDLLREARPTLLVYTLGPFSFPTIAHDGLVNRFVPLADFATAPSGDSEAGRLLGPAHLAALDPSPWSRISAERLSIEREAIRRELADAVAQAFGWGDEGDASLRLYTARVSRLKDPWTRQAETLQGDALTEALSSFHPGWKPSNGTENDNVGAFRLILREFAAAGIPVLVVESPLNPVFADRLEPGTLEAFRTLVADVAREHGAAFVPVGGETAASDFADHVHVNRAGREKLSERLAELLAGILEDAP